MFSCFFCSNMEEDKLNTLFAGLQYDLQLLGLFQTITQRLEQEVQSSMIDKFEVLVAKQPKKPFVIYDDLVYTYEAIDNLACRVANIAKTWNLRPQDSVAIMIQNEPSFIYTFLGNYFQLTTLAFGLLQNFCASMKQTFVYRPE